MPAAAPDPKNPVLGAMSIDASDVQVVYLTPEQIKHLTKVRAGYEKALTCLAQLTPAQAQLLGIPGTDLTEIQTLQPTLSRLDELVPPADEMARLLHTTQASHEHRAATLIHAAAKSARDRAKRDPNAAEVLGALKDLTDYVAEPSDKAVLTKTKKGLIKGKAPKKTAAGAAATPAQAQAAPAASPAAATPATPAAPGTSTAGH